MSIECNAILKCFKVVVDGIAGCTVIEQLIVSLVECELLDQGQCPTTEYNPETEQICSVEGCTSSPLQSLTKDQKANQIVLRVHMKIQQSSQKRELFQVFVKVLRNYGLAQNLQTTLEGNY